MSLISAQKGQLPPAARMVILAKTELLSAAPRSLAVSLSLLLLTASMSKLWAVVRYPDPPQRSWIEGPLVSQSTAVYEATLGFVLLAGLWPRPTWYATVATFGLFTLITAAETLQGKNSCGCFGSVQVRPIYTLFLDLTAVAMLLATGPPPTAARVGLTLPTSNQQPPTSNLGSAGPGSVRRRWIVAGGIGIAWVGIVFGIWLTRPVIAVATTETLDKMFGKPGQTFGNPGDLVVLEPEKWAGQRFSLVDHILADHIDIGSQLTAGQWIVLLVHHDCDHCAAAVPRYVAAVESQKAEGRGQNEDGKTRLAVIEMPPFGDAADPPPWQLPPSVLCGRLDQTRDWFATTPLALRVKDGVILSAKKSDAAETPDP